MEIFAQTFLIDHLFFLDDFLPPHAIAFKQIFKLQNFNIYKSKSCITGCHVSKLKHPLYEFFRIESYKTFLLFPYSMGDIKLIEQYRTYMFYRLIILEYFSKLTVITLNTFDEDRFFKINQAYRKLESMIMSMTKLKSILFSNNRLSFLAKQIILEDVNRGYNIMSDMLNFIVKDFIYSID